MRYFYTDPLKAAWMAKHFNIAFMEDTTLDSTPDDARNVCLDTAYEADCGWGRVENGKYYIEPDCYGMLKPQVGDIVTWTLNHGDDDEELVIKKVLQDGQVDIKWITHFFNDNQFCRYNRKITQRYGKVFFTPETEL